MTHAQTILDLLDSKLTSRVELTLYGRAALQLGFEHPPHECAFSQDVDAVLWLGQTEHLLETSNFWDALEQVNDELRGHELYMSHLFEEDQVILTPEWRTSRSPLSGAWQHLDLYRLGNIDLLLSKLMRHDPIDRHDARFIAQAANLTSEVVQAAIKRARVPDVPEIREEFEICSADILDWLNQRP